MYTRRLRAANTPQSKQLHATLCVFNRLSAALLHKLLRDPEGSERLSRHANWLPWVALRHKHILEESEEGKEKKKNSAGSAAGAEDVSCWMQEHSARVAQKSASAANSFKLIPVETTGMMPGRVVRRVNSIWGVNGREQRCTGPKSRDRLQTSIKMNGFFVIKEKLSKQRPKYTAFIQCCYSVYTLRRC